MSAAARFLHPGPENPVDVARITHRSRSPFPARRHLPRSRTGHSRRPHPLRAAGRSDDDAGCTGVGLQRPTSRPRKALGGNGAGASPFRCMLCGPGGRRRRRLGARPGARRVASPEETSCTSNYSRDAALPPGGDSMSRLRRLPFDGPEGKPAYIPCDNPDGPLSRFADAIEAQQLEAGATVLGLVRPMLGVTLTLDEAMFMLRRTAECLRDALGVAESRGQLGLPDQPFSGIAAEEAPSPAPKRPLTDDVSGHGRSADAWRQGAEGSPGSRRRQHGCASAGPPRASVPGRTTWRVALPGTSASR